MRVVGKSVLVSKRWAEMFGQVYTNNDTCLTEIVNSKWSCVLAWKECSHLALVKYIHLHNCFLSFSKAVM